jgi:hypothetical protein
MGPSGPRTPGSIRPLLIAVAATGLVILAAAATPEGWAFHRLDRPDRVVTPDTPLLFTYMALFLVLAACAVALWLHVSAMQRGLVPRKQPSLIGTIITVILVLALWTMSPTLRQWAQDRFGGDGRAEEVEPTPGPTLEPDPVEQEPSSAYGFVITAILFVIFAATIIGTMWLFRPAQPEDVEEPIEPELLMRELDRTIDDLRAIDDPRAAVIAAYARMEAVSAAAGVKRRASDTPFEHLARLLASHDVAQPSARRLTELFERAKFSNQSIDEQMRSEAIDALEEVRRQLGATV